LRFSDGRLTVTEDTVAGLALFGMNVSFSGEYRKAV
jgi:hypothetical protein